MTTVTAACLYKRPQMYLARGFCPRAPCGLHLPANRGETLARRTGHTYSYLHVW